MQVQVNVFSKVCVELLVDDDTSHLVENYGLRRRVLI